MNYLQVSIRYLSVATLSLSIALLSGAAPTGDTPKPAVNEDVEKAAASFRKGLFDEALTHLQAAVKRDPKLPPPRLILARFFMEAKEGQAARQILEQAMAETPDHPEVYLTNGSLALAEGRVTDTILNLQTALALADAERFTAEQRRNYRRECRAGLATSFEARKDWNAARGQLNAWLEMEPSNAIVRQRLARATFLIGKVDEAYAELQAANKQDSSLDPAEVSMALLWNLKEDEKKAEEWFQKATGRQPPSVKAHRAYAGWLLDRNRLDAAKVHIDAALKLEPDSRETAGLRGLLARQSGDLATAEKVFEEMYRAAPGNFFASNQLALVLIESKDEKQRQRAVQLAEVNARQYQRNAEALATAGWVYYKIGGKAQEAEQLLVGAAQASGGQTNADTAYYLARLLVDKDRADDAVKLLEKALASTGTFINRGEAAKFLPEAKKKVKPAETKK